jgi:hypothetical protein
MALEPDIEERVRIDFGAAFERAIDLIRASGKHGRTARCIVVASRGSLELLRDQIRVAERDDRDSIMEGEYDSARRPIRDLRVSFMLDGPETFWVGEVACMMASRGYVLTSLVTRAATIPPFQYAADFGEGRAKFLGAQGEVEVEKKDRRWLVCGDPKELEKHSLNHPFDDEREFRDAVSGFLLMRGH